MSVPESGPLPGGAVDTERRLRAMEALVADVPGTINDGRLSQATLDAQYASVADADGKSPATALVLAGVGQGYVSTPDHADFNPAAELEIVWRCAPSDYTPAGQNVIAAKRSTAAGLAWQLVHSATTGALIFSFRTGSTDYYTNAEISNPGWVDGTFYWFRFRRTAATGVVTADYAADAAEEPSTWTPLTSGGTQTAGTVDDNAAPVTIGATREGASDGFIGKFSRLMVRNAFDGANVADFRADAPHGTRMVDATGKMWTINGSGWAFTPKG